MSAAQTRAQWLGIQPGGQDQAQDGPDPGAPVGDPYAWSEADSAVAFDCDLIRERLDALDETIAEGLTQLREPVSE